MRLAACMSLSLWSRLSKRRSTSLKRSVTTWDWAGVPIDARTLLWTRLTVYEKQKRKFKVHEAFRGEVHKFTKPRSIMSPSLQRPPSTTFDAGMRPTTNFARPDPPRRPTPGAVASRQLLNAPVPFSVDSMPAPSFIPTRNIDTAVRQWHANSGCLLTSFSVNERGQKVHSSRRYRRRG